VLIQFRVENHRSLRDEQILSLAASSDKAGEHVLKVWLFAWPHGRKATWFERDGDAFEFGKMLHGENEVIRTLTRPNSLFLSAAAQNNHPQLLPLVHYFRSWRFPPSGRGVMIGRAPEMSRLVRELDAVAEHADRSSLLQLLQAADTGIVDVRIDSGVAGSQSSRGVRPTSAKASSVHVRHRSADESYAWLPLALESAGTLALLELAPDILDALRHGGLLCVDELESSLHPALAVSVVGLFNDPKTNSNNAQLIFATHDTNLLGTIVGEPALRRDQVWFTEKDETGGTHLYPLTDFHPRKEENLERGYLQGRYGAVPFVGELVAKVEGDEEE
jgi:predicted ATPase